MTWLREVFNMGPMISQALPRLLAGAMLFLPAVMSAQTLTETVLGTITLQGPQANRNVISPRADHFARRERVDNKERYVTVEGPGESFDRIHGHGVWIQDRLVYLAQNEGVEFLIDGAEKIELKGTPTSPAGLPAPWRSPDSTSYCAFALDGKKVRWYRDGKLQPSTFERVAPLSGMTLGQSAPFFVGANNCRLRLVAGQTAAGKVPWDVINMVCATPDGAVALVYGERASLPLLYLNDKVVLREKATSLAISRDGATWLALVNRPVEETPHMVILQNGVQVAEADVTPMQQLFFAAADGPTWVWHLLQEDGSVILRQPGKEDRKLNPKPHEYHLSEDGKREAYVQIKPERTEVTVDGRLLEDHPIAQGRFCFGPGAAFAFSGEDDTGTVSVFSHLGVGPKFDTVSHPIRFFPDGQPVYAGKRGAEHFIVAGQTVLPVPADHLHGVDGLWVEGATAAVIGTRGDSIIQFKVSL